MGELIWKTVGSKQCPNKQSKRNFVRHAIQCYIRDTIRIAVVAAMGEPIRKTVGSKQCAVN